MTTTCLHSQDSSKDEELKGNVKTILSAITGLIAPPAGSSGEMEKFWDRLDKALPSQKRPSSPAPSAGKEGSVDEDLEIKVECEFLLGGGDEVIRAEV